jgi:hypothetical protein
LQTIFSVASEYPFEKIKCSIHNFLPHRIAITTKMMMKKGGGDSYYFLSTYSTPGALTWILPESLQPVK